MPGSRWLWGTALVIGAISWAGVSFNTASLSLGQEEAVAQRYRPGRPSALPVTPIGKLRMPWNSEAAADWPAAEVLASISKLSYLPPAEAEPHYRALGFHRIRPFSVKSLHGYVVSSDDIAVIAFRGTDELSEWIVNLGALSYFTPQGDIHEGYYRAYRSLKPQIMNLLNESRPQKIWITGHSLGGALALVCAYDLATQERVKPYGLMTFGQPMVVDQFLAAYLDELLLGRYAHFVNDEDIVPRLPPGFAHCGSLVWLTDGEIRRSPPKQRVRSVSLDNSRLHQNELIQPLSAQEFAELKAELQAAENHGRPAVTRSEFSRDAPEWIRDHSMSLYLRTIQSMIRPDE